MFGMHIGSVLSGLGIINVNTDLKMLSLLVFWVENGLVWGGSKMRVFSMFGGLEGDLYNDTYEAKLFGMHGGRFSVMWTSHGSQPFRRYFSPNLCLGSKMRVYGQK